jgi:hypothetical protein
MCNFTFVKIKETLFGDILEVNSWIMSFPPFSQQDFLFLSLVANFRKLVVIFGEFFLNNAILRKLFKGGHSFKNI